MRQTGALNQGSVVVVAWNEEMAFADLVQTGDVEILVTNYW